MLITLHLKNFAIIDELFLEFEKGFSVFSGETGAGKSILINALTLLLGVRASSEYIQSGKNCAIIEGTFHITNNSPLLPLLEEKGFDFENQEIFIKRKIFTNEKSNRCFLNHQACSLSLLSKVGKWLVDIHGQQEHQSLLLSERHIDLLDAFGNLNDLRKKFFSVFKNYKKKEEELTHFLSLKKTNEKEQELLKFEMKEIDQANLIPDEDRILEEQKEKLLNAEKLFHDTNFIYQEVYEKQGALLDNLNEINNRLKSLANIDNFFLPLAGSLENVLYTLEDISSQCRTYSKEIEFNSHLLDEIEDRMIIIQKLKRKFGNSIAEILSLRKKMEEKWQKLQHTEDIIEDLSSQFKKLGKRVSELSDTLSLERQKIAKDIEKEMKKELIDLKMPKARLLIQFRKKETEPSIDQEQSLSYQFPHRITSKGIDTIEFLFSANQGEELKTLTKVASGGELSRIMLALKTCLRSSDKVPILVFDEVDIGIGGDISRIVGKKLQKLALEKQLLCITHSPQIASLAKHHYMVQKIIDNNRTKTIVKKLNNESRIQELTRMLGGGDSSITIKHAQKLIQDSKIL